MIEDGKPKINYKELIEAIKEAMKEHMDTLRPQEKEPVMTKNTRKLLVKRGEAFRKRNAKEYINYHKEYMNSYAKDQNTAVLRTLRADLDVRDKWLGIRQIKQKYQPRPYHRKYADGTPVAPKDLAEQAAQYLANMVWKKTTE